MARSRPFPFLQLLLPAVAGALGVGLWQIAHAALSDDFRFLLPAPAAVLAAFQEHDALTNLSQIEQ